MTYELGEHVISYLKSMIKILNDLAELVKGGSSTKLLYKFNPLKTRGGGGGVDQLSLCNFVRKSFSETDGHTLQKSSISSIFSRLCSFCRLRNDLLMQ